MWSIMFTRAAGSREPLLYTNEKSNYLTNSSVCQWLANCGPRPNCGPLSTFCWATQHLLLWAVWHVRAKELRRLHGLKHRLLQYL